ncbi:MAG: glycosyltransferase [Isosphaeraceae bacterium]|nr:glycosyltransferase [Isosphaeraceae bacterium]
MHVLFVHQNFPAQFGHIARHLIRSHGFQCSFVSELPPGVFDGVRRFQYRPQGGATEHNHYFTRSFENAVAHAQGVYEACRRQPDLRPDLIVGHSGFGSTLFLRELYDCPIINYFEYFYRPHDSDMDFRPEFRAAEIDILRCYCRNAMFLLDLENCDAGYSPTHWQRSTLPAAYAPKVEVIFDGIETEIWHRHEGLPRRIGAREIPPDTRIVTYVSRGFEAIRGFDIFMKVARRIYRRMPNVVFAVVGTDRIAYGGDLKFIKEKSFREYVLKQDHYDLSRFLFLGYVPPAQLARLLSISDLHIYLTADFILSWSAFNALACGCTVLASDTAPVRELIRHEDNGLLAEFYDVEGLADWALRVLRDPEAYRPLGQAGMDLITEQYSLSRCLPQMLDFYRRVVNRSPRLYDEVPPPPLPSGRPASPKALGPQPARAPLGTR